MTGSAVLRLIVRRGGEVVRRHGSHVRVRVGAALTTVPVHRGEDLGPGLLRAIERDLESEFGKGWLRR